MPSQGGERPEVGTASAAAGRLEKPGELENSVMPSRERWIVYPLLLLTFGIVMGDKIVPQAQFQSAEIAAERIRCGQLQVDEVVAPGRIVVRSLQCGEFSVAGPNGRPTVIILTDPRNKGGAIETLSSTGASLVRLLPTNSGGVVVASEFLSAVRLLPRSRTPRRSPRRNSRRRSPKEPPPRRVSERRWQRVSANKGGFLIVER